MKALSDNARIEAEELQRAINWAELAGATATAAVLKQIYVGRFGPMQTRWADWSDPETRLGYRPTHWMPLPPSPNIRNLPRDETGPAS